MATQYLIPDLLVTWPWKRLINPMLAEVDDEANAWVKSLDLLEPAQLPNFSSCRFSTCRLFFSSHEYLNLNADQYFLDLLAALSGPLLECKGWFLSTRKPLYVLFIYVRL